MRIYLSDKLFAGSFTQVLVIYETTPAGRAVSWLNATQTDSKKMPYMFTECQPINCRSVAPMQDTPAIKSLYSANITVIKGFVVHMSAVSTGVLENKTH